MPRQGDILGELRTRGIKQKEMCDILKAKYHEDVSEQTFSNIMRGARSETPKGERVIKFVRKYLEETK